MLNFNDPKSISSVSQLDFFSLILKSAAHQQNSKWGFPLLKCQQAMKLLMVKRDVKIINHPGKVILVLRGLGLWKDAHNRYCE
jgi:hypothetical protein